MLRVRAFDSQQFGSEMKGFNFWPFFGEEKFSIVVHFHLNVPSVQINGDMNLKFSGIVEGQITHI